MLGFAISVNWPVDRLRSPKYPPPVAPTINPESSAAVPAALVPIKLPAITLPVVPAPVISTPSPVLPEMTLPAPARDAADRVVGSAAVDQDPVADVAQRGRARRVGADLVPFDQVVRGCRGRP